MPKGDHKPTSGAPLVARYRGDLRPVYRHLQIKMPQHAACRTWKGLAHAITRCVEPNRSADILVQNLERDLGNEVIDGEHHMKVKYFDAFTKVLGLQALGITDEMLLLPDVDTRLAAIDAALDANPFELLLAQTRQDDRVALGMIAAAPGSATHVALGPNSSDFVPPPIDVENGVPVGRRFHFSIVMPWDGYVTLMSRDPILHLSEGQPYRPVHALDRLAGCYERRFSLGRSVLDGELRMDPPPGLTTVIMVACRDAIEPPWDQRASQSLPTASLSRFAASLAARGRDQYCVGRLDFNVIA